MRAIQVKSWAEGPQELTFDKPPTPSPSQIQLRVQAAGLHQVVRSRASGKHYSAQMLPHTLGIDGVGLDEATGTSYYIMGMAPDFGTFAEYVNVGKKAAVAVPEGVDPAALAASVNPGLSSWLALTTRCTDLPPNFTVLILGATTASGELAASLSRKLGASSVIGVARNVEALKKINGLDRWIELKPGAETDYSGLEKVDVVLDYVYGDAAVHLLSSLPQGRPVQYVQIGSMSGQDAIALPSAVLRSKNLTLRGSGPGAWSIAELGQQMPKLIEALASLTLKQPQKFPLEQFAKVWPDTELAKKGRVVFTL